MRILERQVGAARPRRATVSRNVRVLGHPQRLKTMVLRCAGEVHDAYAVVRREHEDAELHGVRISSWRLSRDDKTVGMIIGAHSIIYAADAERTRAFIRDV